MSLRVDEKQTGFIIGRSIIDSIATTQEVLHQYKKTKMSMYLLKIDFEKAYDMVGWDALVKTLCFRGFGEPWICWIEWKKLRYPPMVELEKKNASEEAFDRAIHYHLCSFLSLRMPSTLWSTMLRMCPICRGCRPLPHIKS